MPRGVLTNGDGYSFRARVRDGAVNPATGVKDLWSAWSAPQVFTVDVGPDKPNEVRADPVDGDVLESLTPKFEAQLTDSETGVGQLVMDMVIRDSGGSQVGATLSSVPVDSGFRAQIEVPEEQGLAWGTAYTFWLTNRDPASGKLNRL